MCFMSGGYDILTGFVPLVTATFKLEEDNIAMARTALNSSPLSRGGLSTAPKHNIMIIALFILLQLTTFAWAGVVFTNDEYVVRPGEPFTINWEGNRAPVTLKLMRGPDVDLQEVMVIASGLSGTKYTWTPPQTLKQDSYELYIEDGVSVDYSPRFQYPAPPDPTTITTPTQPTRPIPTTFVTTSSTSTTSTLGSPPPATTSSSATATSETEGLSTGAKAGIAVGASILGLAILAFLGWFIYNRGKKAGVSNTNNQNMTEGGRGGGPVGGYYAPSGTDNFDQDTVIGGSSVAGGGGAGYKPWAAGGTARATTPFAELGQPEYTTQELWAGGIYQGQGQGGDNTGGSKGMADVQERSYSVPMQLPIQHPGVTNTNNPPGYEYNPDQIQQAQRIQDDWHAVVSPASRAGTGVGSVSNSNFSGTAGPGTIGPGGFDFGTSPANVTSSPAPMGYSATVTAGGPPSTPLPGLGRYARDGGSDGSPLSFAARVADEDDGQRGTGYGQGHGRTGSRGQSRGGY